MPTRSGIVCGLFLHLLETRLKAHLEAQIRYILSLLVVLRKSGFKHGYLDKETASIGCHADLSIGGLRWMVNVDNLFHICCLWKQLLMRTVGQ